MANAIEDQAVQLAYIGCWYKNDMYSHNCSNLVDSLRAAGLKVDVVTSNCRCFSTAQRFAIADEELINLNCSAIKIPHAPRYPGLKHGRMKYWTVKIFRLDLLLAIIRGFLYYKRARRADVIHFDQVLEAFGCIPLFIVIMLGGVFKKTLTVSVHEIDPFQREHLWVNHLYKSCAEVFVYSEDMRRQLVEIGVDLANVKVIRYGALIPELTSFERTKYIYFGGHNIQRGKGYSGLIGALVKLKAANKKISLVIYVGYGCNGLVEAKKLAEDNNISDMIEWRDFYSGAELAWAYQRSKACIIPYTGGSARHPLTCAMVNATPVIATRTVDIPEYLGDLGIYIDSSAESLVAAIMEVENGTRDFVELGKRLHAKALAELDYQKIAEELSAEYARIGGKAPLVQCPTHNVA